MDYVGFPNQPERNTQLSFGASSGLIRAVRKKRLFGNLLSLKKVINSTKLIQRTLNKKR